MKTLLVLFSLLVAPFAAASITGTAAVTDGDTLRIGPVIVRIHGIDAPETGQTCRTTEGKHWNCGAAAANRLAALADGRMISCEALARDRYGRIVARCSAAGVDLGRGAHLLCAARTVRRQFRPWPLRDRRILQPAGHILVLFVIGIGEGFEERVVAQSTAELLRRGGPDCLELHITCIIAYICCRRKVELSLSGKIELSRSP